jgi:cytochrome bd-type quinol oxidase subunit 2
LAILIAILIALIGAAIAHIFTKGQSRKRKYIIWGIANMVAIGPFLSFAIGITYAIIEGNGWAGMLMWVVYPIIFVIGLIQLIIGIFMKKSSHKNNYKYH